MRVPGNLSILGSRCSFRRPRTTQILAVIGATEQGYHRFVAIDTKLLHSKTFSTTSNFNHWKEELGDDKLLQMKDSIRVGVAGCGHGTLNAIYASVAESCKLRGIDTIDILIIGGDFQATRNAADLTVMSVPAKYRQLGDFPKYYSGEKKAPYLTIFAAGNHEASAYLSELYYGGWVAPNIYYLGAANVLRFGPLRIAAVGGIWNEPHYHKTHQERVPFNYRDIRSFYHMREFDVRKLLLLREQVDIGLSHDWPQGIERLGNHERLFARKPDFKAESNRGELGNPAAAYIMDRLRPAYWFSAHLHIKYPAIKTYEDSSSEVPPEEISEKAEHLLTATEEVAANPDEIDLDMEDDEDGQVPAEPTDATTATTSATTTDQVVSDELRAQLPASFAKPTPAASGLNPGQPVPPTITNKTTRFLSLDKCLPRRGYLQLCPIQPIDPAQTEKFPPSKNPKQRFSLQYDPEWLAITRVFAPYLTIGDPNAVTPPNLGEEAYRPMIDRERAWVEENIVSKGKLAVPENFAKTAPPHRKGDPEFVQFQPDEYTNPQTTAFCELLDVPNLWDATPEERAERKANAPPMEFPTGGGGGGGRGRGRGGFGRGGAGRGRGGRGRGNRGGSKG
ncbi:lariat debranching enzyme, C-terminal domain-containing protein [Jackrogersella minutella]|nr:lariat debranching enzyme, C-terminal domain-containing protein [Jackrogersella minutella]